MYVCVCVYIHIYVCIYETTYGTGAPTSDLEDSFSGLKTVRGSDFTESALRK